jgi:hypothetical protein
MEYHPTGLCHLFLYGRAISKSAADEHYVLALESRTIRVSSSTHGIIYLSFTVLTKPASQLEASIGYAAERLSLLSDN